MTFTDVSLDERCKKSVAVLRLASRLSRCASDSQQSLPVPHRFKQGQGEKCVTVGRTAALMMMEPARGFSSPLPVAFKV